MVFGFVGKDKLNKKGLRTFEVTNRLGYNCGGYALETFNWYCPYEKAYDSPFDSEMIEEEILKVTVEHMLKEFKGRLRVIESEKDLKEGEYMIAYRVSCNDFHFAKRNSKGVWFHKRGKTPKIDRFTKTELLLKNWIGEYNSEIVFLAKKKSWN